MDYLSYNPSCEAYIATRDAAGNPKYYDVTRDISSMRVTRQIDDASSFSLRLQNKNRKYDGLFSAMDRIKLYATKTERHALLTGYITEVTALQMYAGDIEISGKCSLYRLQQLFWDPKLIASQQLQGIGDFNTNGYEEVVYRMLTQVAGMSKDNIKMGGIPSSVMTWAMNMYQAQASDFEQAENIMKAFDDMLSNHGPKFVKSDGTAGYSGGQIIDVDVSDKQDIWDFFTKELSFSDMAAAAIMGTWQAESGIDPTGVEGIYDEPHQMGPKKKAAMANPQSYTLNTLFPMYANAGLSIYREAYIGEDGKYYPGIGFAGFTGPRVTQLFATAKKIGKPWYTADVQLNQFAMDIKGNWKYLLSDDFQKETNIYAATKKFVECYEMPGGIYESWLIDRVDNARVIYKTFSGKDA